MSDFVKREDAYRIALRYGGSIAGNKIEQLPAVDVSMDTIRAEHEAFRVASVRIAMLAKENAELKAQIPHWVSVEERKPPEYTDVWCAVYTTDIIYMEDGETPEEAIENRQCEAARNPRMTLGSYSEDEGWTDGYYGMPMVCRPDYWLEMTIPEPPREVQE